MSEILPFLTTLVPSAPRALGTALRTITPAKLASPWSPQELIGAGGAPSADDLGAIEAEARARGHAEGLAETAALRAQALVLVAELTAARDATITGLAQRIADAAAAVVGGWTDRAPAPDLFGSIVRAWVERHAAPATAHVAPTHVDGLRELIGEAAIEIVADPQLRGGDLRICSGTLEIEHAWEPRLRELRDAIATALEAVA